MLFYSSVHKARNNNVRLKLDIDSVLSRTVVFRFPSDL